MKILIHQEVNQVQGAGLIAAIIAGSATTLLGWSAIVYYKDATYQLYKPQNIALVGSLGTLVGGIAYTAGVLI
jgi:uncharacterized protein (DUF697 family)